MGRDGQYRKFFQLIRAVRYDGNVRMKLRLALSGSRSAVSHTACGTVEAFGWSCGCIQDLTGRSESDGIVKSDESFASVWLVERNLRCCNWSRPYPHIYINVGVRTDWTT